MYIPAQHSLLYLSQFASNKKKINRSNNHKTIIKSICFSHSPFHTTIVCALAFDEEEIQPMNMTGKKLHVAWGPYCGPDTDCLSEEEPLDQFRVEFLRGPGVQVTGWPAKGGVYILERCLGVELDFLGLDRFHNTPRPSGPDAAAEEEAHCNKSKNHFTGAYNAFIAPQQ